MTETVENQLTFQNLALRTGATLLATALTAIGLLMPRPVLAQTMCTGTNCPPTYTFTDKQIQRVGSTLKLQARISQAKMPVGEAVFNNIYVRIKESPNGESLCSATFPEVRVADSVLNLELGSRFDCQLDDLIARSADLLIQVCIDNTTNCLKPIEMATVPYSIKSTYARHAQEAQVAETAAQANYAHRITADSSIFVNGQFGTGYFDFATPTTSTAAPGFTGTSITNSQAVMKWTPIGTTTTAKTIYIVGQNMTSSALEQLDSIYLSTSNLRLPANANVTGNIRFPNTVTFPSGSTLDLSAATVMMPASGGSQTVNGSITVNAPSGTASTNGITANATATNQAAGHFSSTNSDVALSGSTVVGGVVRVVQGTTQILLDGNEIQAINGTAAASLSIQDLGGDFIVGSNNLRVTAAGNVGIGTAAPGARLHVTDGTSVGSTSGGYFHVGNSNVMAFDDNEIQARDSAGAPRQLHLNARGGKTAVGATGTAVGTLHVGAGPSSVVSDDGWISMGSSTGAHATMGPNWMQSWNGTAAADLSVNVALGASTHIGPLGTLSVNPSGFTGLGTTLIGGPAHRLHVFQDSSTTSFHAYLHENGNDHARLAFANNQTTNAWQIAGYPNATASSARLNFFYPGPGDVMSIKGSGRVSIQRFSAGVATPTLCFNASNEIGTCSSSARYKDDIRDLDLGLSTVLEARPVTFVSKEDGVADVGFIAEEMADIDERLIFRNEDGLPDGVRYMQFTAVLVNAVQEQQVQIESQEVSLARLKEQVATQNRALSSQAAELVELKALICEAMPKAAPCRKR